MYPRATREQAIRLLEAGLSVSSVSRSTGVNRSTLRAWRDHGIEVVRSSVCWRCDATLPVPAAYAALFGYYLGDGCLSAARRTVFTLRISCDRRYPGIVRDVSRIIPDVHSGAVVTHVAAPGAVVVKNSWKHWPCLFPQHGPGRKHERALGMTEWQWQLVERRPADFLRGLFHSDGCRTNNWTRRMVAGRMKRYDYPRWQFTNSSTEIQQWCCDALDLVEVPWRQSNWKTISVSTRAGVARLDELIGLKS